ncbi:uncharacterized protein N0V89_005173 [Didymosphaeria variabile]|uniref:Uncharacterized protein n=1 Tax=Didymosphaeria variabile TaxID=1932322 RepID=A0A9W8XL41_9PLEO|nr:uncharacterized protein N0V89_005173 [Didymosphaeria variabile]KAJ4353444.1 hypothetical protein N0V89_005173 [Didymosphaeria variabile]
MMATPRASSAFGGRMKKVLQRIWAGAKRYRKAMRTAQMMEHSDIPPPPYTRFIEDVVEEALIRKSNKGTGLKTTEDLVSKPNTNAVPKLSEDTVSKPTSSSDQKPIEKTVIRSTPISQLERDYSAFAYPRLILLTENKLDTVKLLRSILVFVMFITFHAELDIISTDTGRLFPWNTTITTRTDADPSKFFHWDVFEITYDVCTLVRYLEQQLRDNRWFSVRREHKDLITKLVLKPAESLMIQADYVLEILGTFEQDGFVGDSIDYYTLVDYWKRQKPQNLPRSPSSILDLGDTLASHASLIVSLNLQDEQQSELENSMAKYIEKRNLNKIQMSETLKQTTLEELKYRPHGICCWPIRDGYIDLFRMLGKVDGSCWRDVLKLERERRRDQSELPPRAIGITL